MNEGFLVILRPFTCNQKFYLFKNGEVTFEGHLPYDDRFAEEILEFAHIHQLNTINISGPYGYAIKTSEGIQEKCASKYSNENIIVNILSKKS